jgi:hypothetical protein
MSMRKSTRQELRKCREIIRFILRGKKCWFYGRKNHPDCKGLLIHSKSYAKDGDGQGSPVRSITIHHIDSNHGNDRDNNKALVHDSCHRRHHALERAAERRR